VTNNVRITFDFHDLPDGADADVIEDAVDDLQLIVQDLNGCSAEELQHQVAAVVDPDREHRARSEHVDVRVEVIR